MNPLDTAITKRTHWHSAQSVQIQSGRGPGVRCRSGDAIEARIASVSHARASSPRATKRTQRPGPRRGVARPGLVRKTNPICRRKGVPMRRLENQPRAHATAPQRACAPASSPPNTNPKRERGRARERLLVHAVSVALPNEPNGPAQGQREPVRKTNPILRRKFRPMRRLENHPQAHATASQRACAEAMSRLSRQDRKARCVAFGSPPGSGRGMPRPCAVATASKADYETKPMGRWGTLERRLQVGDYETNPITMKEA